MGRVVVITPTGGRGYSLDLLDKYLKRQTYQNFVWMVLDDCEPKAKEPERCDLFIDPDWVWKKGCGVTQAKSMLKLLSHCGPEDKIIICEDDDWYCPKYVETLVEKLDYNQLVGESHSLYYNIISRTYLNCKNKGRGSLCSSGFTGEEVLNTIKTICSGRTTKTIRPHVCRLLWKKTRPEIKKAFFNEGERLCLGTKGLSGRTGIGKGHKRLPNSDEDMSLLKSIVGEDFSYYEKFFK